MQLTDSERQSPLWHKINDYLLAQVENAQLDLEKVQKNDKSLNDDVLKGMILAYRRLLAKAKEHQQET